MQHICRLLEMQVSSAAESFPAVVLTGPRRSGKTSLLRALFKKAPYFLLEDPDVVSRFRQDPQGFLDAFHGPVILDEVQNVPEIFSFVRARIDRQPRKMGQWFLTGSQEAPLMRNVTESMAGRAAVLQLLPLSTQETAKVSMLLGGYPEVLARPKAAGLWFSSYLQTYLERDVRAVSMVHDLATFRRFLSLLATRHGQMLNKSDLASPLGMSVPGIGKWLDILETTQQILLVPPFYENAGKRLIKSPKVYIHDSGLACHLLGIETVRELEKSPFLGSLFEGFVVSELAKTQLNAGKRKEIYYFRDQQGLEVDFVVPQKNGGVLLMEAKTTHTPTPAMATSMVRLADALRKRRSIRGEVSCVLVHRPARAQVKSHALLPGAKAIPVAEFLSGLPGG